MRIEELFPIAQSLQVVDMHGDETGITLKIVGSDSKQYRDAALKGTKATLGKSPQEDYELFDNANAEITASSIVGWEGLEDANGPIPYTPAKAVELMMMPELKFIRDQVDSLVSKRAEFFRQRNVEAGSKDQTGPPPRGGKQ